MFPSDFSSFLLVAGIGLLCYLLLRRSWGRLGRSRQQDAADIHRPAAAGARRQSSLSDSPSEVVRWQVELHETARDIKAEIDTKLAALQALTIAARQECARLELLIARAQRLHGSVDSLAAIEELADPAAMSDSSRLQQVIDNLPPPSRPAGPSQRRAIQQLSASGLPPAAIAERLGLPVGEVELML